MKMPRLWALVLLAVGSCTSTQSAPAEPGWKTLSPQGCFTVTIPEEMIELPLKPIDSVVGCYGSASLTMRFDFGWYSAPIPEWEGLKRGDYVEEGTRIDGHPATLVFGTLGEGKDRVHIAGVHFPELSKSEDGVTKLTLGLSSPQPIAPSLARRILTSIRFSVK